MRAVYEGIADRMIRLVEEKQLKDRELWRLVTKQFAKTPDDADHGWRGEYWGKLMRGACMTWQYTQDEELYGILTESVRELLAFQEADGRISTYSRQEEFQGWDIWCRKYVLLGLIHFYEICREPELGKQVLEAAGRHLDAIMERIGDGEGKKRITLASDAWKGINSSSILEPVVRLYMLNPQGRYLEFADYIVENGGAEGFDIFQAAFEDRMYPYEYPVVKAYELMSCFEGLLFYAQVKKDDHWRQAVIRFADRLLESEAVVVGGSGCHHELFNHSSLMQTGTEYDGLMLETCVTVTWMKLLSRVYEMTGDERYLEEVERSAFNALYGAVNTENSTCGPETVFDEPNYRDVYDRAVAQNGGRGQLFDSYSPLRAGIRGRAVGGFKSMEQETAYCGCCIAIGAAGTALVPALAVRESYGMERDDSDGKKGIHGVRGVEFGIYLPGRIYTAVEGIPVEFSVDTDYPVDGRTAISMKTDEEVEFPIRLRIPSFAEKAKVFVNGEEQEGALPGTFLELCRRWKTGDRIQLDLSFGPRLVYGMDNPKDPDSGAHVAVLYGPLALARDQRLGQTGTCVRPGDGKASARRLESVKIPCQCGFEVELGGEKLLMVDYASAGKTWLRDSQAEVWMRLSKI
ncbi:MAG: glycoside hydrolase family 127 protein [Acetatifactor sp.]|nr:glycoside hydrolase family 127 protein [Acetatifactor sp.]